MLREEMMTETYTAEDFENAEFARHADGQIAMRAEPETGAPWYVGDDPFKKLDVAMAHEGWVPVSTSAADNDRRVERLKRQATEQDITICRRNREIEELNRRVRALEEVEAAPEPWQAIADAMPSNWPKEVREHAAKTLHEAGAKMGEK